MRSRVLRVLLDVLAAGALAVGIGGNIAAGNWPPPAWMPGWLAWTVVCGVLLPLFLRRRWPLPAYVLGLILTAAATPIGGPVMAVAAIAAGSALYLVTAYGDPRTARIGLAAGLLEVGLLAFAVPNAGVPTTLNVGVTAVVVSFALGIAVRGRREQAERQREDHARQAVSEERLRIAREMHDVVAHSMSLIAVKAAVGNHVAAEQPKEAREALRVIEETSRESLAELRRMLGVLRSGTGVPEAALGPAPALSELRALADRAGQAGPDVKLTIDGLTELPGGVGQSVYRIVQEALTNVVKHAAAGSCRIQVTAWEGEVSIEVIDDGRGAPEFTPGHGLIGMRERVAVYGGEFDAGPTPDGFRVFARLPYEATP